MITEVPAKMKCVIKTKLPTGSPENIYDAMKFIIISDYVYGTSVDIKASLL